MHASYTWTWVPWAGCGGWRRRLSAVFFWKPEKGIDIYGCGGWRRRLSAVFFWKPEKGIDVYGGEKPFKEENVLVFFRFAWNFQHFSSQLKHRNRAPVQRLEGFGLAPSG